MILENITKHEQYRKFQDIHIVFSIMLEAKIAL